MGCQLNHGHEAAHPDPKLRAVVGRSEQPAGFQRRRDDITSA